MTEDLVLLHGFAATGRSWDPVCDRLGERYRPHAIDLAPASLEAAIAATLAASPGSFALCGYSMGGRVALHVALMAPARITNLVLVSATAGIADAAQRARRAAQDAQLADTIDAGTIERFADDWQAQPLFADTPVAVAERWRAEILRCSPQLLAATLRALGPGTVPSVWHRLAELPMPVTVVVGERDEKYVGIGRDLVAAIPDATLRIVPGTGHGVPREAPAELAAILEAL